MKVIPSGLVSRAKGRLTKMTTMVIRSDRRLLIAFNLKTLKLKNKKLNCILWHLTL